MSPDAVIIRTPTLFVLFARPEIPPDGVLQEAECNYIAEIDDVGVDAPDVGVQVTMEALLPDRERGGSLAITAAFGVTALILDMEAAEPAAIAKLVKRVVEAYGHSIQIDCALRFDLAPAQTIPPKAGWNRFGKNEIQELLEGVAAGDIGSETSTRS